MPTELINLLIQIPIVAVFIWYSDRMNKQFMGFIVEQRKEDREAIRSLTEQLKHVAECISGHQEATLKDHAIILDRLATQATKKEPVK